MSPLAHKLVLGTICSLLLATLGSAIRITGATSGIDGTSRVRPFRREINEFSRSGPGWDLYVLALQRFQNEGIDNQLSYYQIAGIHGWPSRPWDDVAGDGRDGFCMHDSVLFPLWHRPYLALYEQILSYHAQIIAKEYPPELRDEYETAAQLLRIPYWDWAINYALPDVTTTPTLSLNTPAGPQIIPNPLLQYDFPVDMVASGYFLPDIRVSNLSHTARQYNFKTGQSNQAAASTALVGRSATNLQELYELFSRVDNYTLFSAYKLAGQLNNSPNLERTHGNIHNDVGGMYGIGHMTIFPESAFDPVFWLHHANVDRIVAMWQAIHPDSYVEPVLNTEGTYFLPPNSIDSIDTPLAPFHSDDDGNIWTAAMVRDTAVFGYTYPEVTDWNVSSAGLAADVRTKVNQLYNPKILPLTNSTRRVRMRRGLDIAQAMSNVDASTALELGVNNLESQWFLGVTVDQKTAGSDLTVCLFMGRPTGDTRSCSAATNLIGMHTPPFTADMSEVASEEVQQDMIPCTHSVAAAVERGMLSSLDSEVVIPFLTQNVVAKVLDSTGMEVSLDMIGGVQISVLSRSVEPRKTISEFPIYGELEERAYVIG